MTTGSDEPIDYAQLEEAYGGVQEAEYEPNIGLMSVRSYYFWLFYMGIFPKMPRKRKKALIGTRKQRRRFVLQGYRMKSKPPLKVSIVLDKIEIEVRPRKLGRPYRLHPRGVSAKTPAAQDASIAVAVAKYGRKS